MFYKMCRFSIVAEINMSELKIHIKIKTQNLSPGVNYRVHLIFRFSGPKRSLAKRMYVNLKYKMGNQNMSSYIASWRDDDWMMIGLYQFLNKKEDTEFEVLLESLSRSYCGNRTIYVEGIEFQAIEKVSAHAPLVPILYSFDIFPDRGSHDNFFMLNITWL